MKIYATFPNLKKGVIEEQLIETENYKRDELKEIIYSDMGGTTMIEYSIKTIIAKNLIDEMAVTINCPCNWRDIGEELAEEYRDDDWVMDNCRLYEYEI